MPVSLEVGKYVSSGSITWKVLAVKDSTVLLLSKDILARLPYYVDYDENRRGYADSIIRSWLNKAFVNSLPYEFTKRIIPTKLEVTDHVDGFDYAKYGLEEEDSVEDRVFLLSEDEAKVLFLNDASRRAYLNLDYIRDAEPQSFAATSQDDRSYAESCNSWWLRTSNPDIHREVSSDGSIVDTDAPLIASSYQILDLDRSLYDKMEPDLARSYLNMMATLLDIRGLKTAFTTALMGARGFIGVRPALWFDFEK